MKTRITHITETLQVKAGLLATRSIVAAIAGSGVIANGPGRP